MCHDGSAYVVRVEARAGNVGKRPRKEEEREFF